MMKEGFYEKIITESIAQALIKESDKTVLLESFSKSDGSVLIHRYFQQFLQRAFNQLIEERDEIAKKKLIDFTNDLIRLTAEYLNDEEFNHEQISKQGQILKNTSKNPSQ